MAFEITSSAHPRMLVLRAHGTGSGAEGLQAFQEMQAHAAYYHGVPVLIDATRLDYTPSPAETRIVAGLFATAFPCSLLAIVGMPGASYEPARDITDLSVSRGTTVAAFMDRQEALAWLTGESASSKRLADGVFIPYTLREKIETTHLDVDGYDCPLRLDSAAGRPVVEPDVAEVTVSTEYRGSAKLATVDVRVSSLDDEEYVVSAVVNAMKAVLAGAQAPSHALASAGPR
jgi:hypothetical protein